jgi:CBS domain-containing protein
MKKYEPVAKIMTTELVTVHGGQKLSDVRKILADNKLHHVPVVSGKVLLGMVSSTDITRLSFGAYGADDRSIDATLDHDFELKDAMQKNLVTVSKEDSVRSAAELLAQADFHSLPVVDGDKNLVGIITSTDIIKYLLAQY